MSYVDHDVRSSIFHVKLSVYTVWVSFVRQLGFTNVTHHECTLRLSLLCTMLNRTLTDSLAL